jgi:hypothetical protein
MQELVPLASGLFVGLISLLFSSTRIRAIVIVVLSVFGAILVGATNGELAVSWWFVAFDMCLIVGAAVVTIMLARLFVSVQMK